MRRTGKTIILAALLVLAAEALYTDVERSDWRTDDGVVWLTRIHAGMPFRSLQCTTRDLDDVLYVGHPERDMWDAGVKVKPELLVCDLLTAILLVLLLSVTVPAGVLLSLLAMSALGVCIGAGIHALDHIAAVPRSGIPAGIVLVMLFSIIPLAAYVMSLRFRRAKTVMVVGTALGALTFVRAGFALEVLLKGGVLALEPEERVPMLLAAGGFTAVLVVAGLLLRLIHRWLWPRFVRKTHGARVQPSADVRHLPDRQEPSRPSLVRTKRQAVVCLVLLVVTLYVGHHFTLVETIRYHASARTRVDGIDRLILDRLRQQTGLGRQTSLDLAVRSVAGSTKTLILHSRAAVMVPAKERPSILRVELLEESLHGWPGASYRQEVLVNDGATYELRIRKPLLVPWIDVDAHRLDRPPQLGERSDGAAEPGSAHRLHVIEMTADQA